jgi:hypothetical protein
VLVISEPVVDVHPPRSLLHLLRDGRDPLRFEATAPSALDAVYLASLETDREHAFFVAPGDRDSLARLARCFDLDGPLPSPYPLPADERLDLYLAPMGSRRSTCGM